MLHFGAKNTQEIKITLSFGDEVNGYQLTLKVDNNDNLFPLREETTFWDKARYPRPYSRACSDETKSICYVFCSFICITNKHYRPI